MLGGWKDPTEQGSAANAIHDEEVRIGSLALGGSLLLPGRSRVERAALLIGGSGPLDRDGTVGDRKPLRDLALVLAAAGIATLRFDKRTHAMPWLVDPGRITVDEEIIDDATAALLVLRSHPAIRGARIFLVGHSLGGLVAPEIAQRSGDIAGIVLLAPPGRPLSTLIVEQLRAAKAPGAGEAEAQSERILGGIAGDDEMFFGAPASYYRDLENRKEPARAASLGLPVLLLRGSDDRQVGEKDSEAWANALRTSRHFEERCLDGLDHLFYGPDGEFGARATAAIIEFLVGRSS